MVQEHCQGTQNTKSTQRNHPSKSRGVKTHPDRTKTRRQRTLRKLLAYLKTSRTSPYLRDAQHAGLEEANKDGQRRLVTDSHSRFETLEGTRNMPSPSLRSRVRRAAAAARRLLAGVGIAGAMSAAAAAPTPRRSRLTAITGASPQGSSCWTQEFPHPSPFLFTPGGEGRKEGGRKKEGRGGQALGEQV